MKTRERILHCLLELAAEKGLGNVSLSMVAEKVGIRKATLFSHFESKDDMIQSLYTYLREQARNEQMASVDYDKFVQGKSAGQVLMAVVIGYQTMNSQKDMSAFYKFIYSERSINAAAANIMLTETETMLKQTKNLFEAMKKNSLLSFRGKDIDLASTMFCLTIHELMDIELDRRLNNMEDDGKDIQKFITGFCELYA